MTIFEENYFLVIRVQRSKFEMPPHKEVPDNDKVYPIFFHSQITPLTGSSGFIRQL